MPYTSTEDMVRLSDLVVALCVCKQSKYYHWACADTEQLAIRAKTEIVIFFD
jgi:hypothetical protein